MGLQDTYPGPVARGRSSRPGETPDKRELLEPSDVLVDDRFAESLKDLLGQFRGSPNQRAIDVRASLAVGRVAI